MTAPGQRAEHVVLVVDDDPAMAATVADGLTDFGWSTRTATTADDATAAVRDPSVDVLVTDLRMPAVDGIELLALSKTVAPERPVVVMTAFGAIDTAVESLRRGAFHYLLKPFKVAELDLFLGRALEERALRRETRSLKRALGEKYAPSKLVAESDGMREVKALVERVADAGVAVLLTGETGTGKGLVARVLHGLGPRASAPFVSLNCAAVPETLLESELFGHVEGAAPGAVPTRRGFFVEADGGTLFLDEVGDMSPSLQAKLLDVLERGVVRAGGTGRERQVDVRIVAATHRDLRGRVAQGLFREDLLYRLEGVAIEIPPLRQRRDDIPVLVSRFVEDARAAQPRSTVTRLGRDAMERILSYTWPGNVRELEHAVARAVLLGQGEEATLDDLPPQVTRRRASRDALDFGETVIPVRDLQRRYAAWALERSGGRKAITCERLGIDGKTLNKWLSTDEGES
jgi:two-component system, NtrC family, response regulator HydG